MKSIGKSILTLACAGLVLIACLFGVGKVLEPHYDGKEHQEEKHLAYSVLFEEPDTLDVLFVGDSISYAAISPRQMFQAEGFTSYNIATGAQPICYGEAMLEMALRQQNPEIYAWLYVLDTNVNMPGLQSVTDDFYYLDHNDQGEYAPQGAAFTQMANATDFSDPVTVMYGHQAPEDAMITYKIIAAYQYDDRHILNSYDFSDPQVRADYYARLLDPASMLVNMREGVQLSADDRILQLSTCMDAVSRDNTRYLVTGVLVDVQETY